MKWQKILFYFFFSEFTKVNSKPFSYFFDPPKELLRFPIQKKKDIVLVTRLVDAMKNIHNNLLEEKHAKKILYIFKVLTARINQFLSTEIRIFHLIPRTVRKKWAKCGKYCQKRLTQEQQTKITETAEDFNGNTPWIRNVCVSLPHKYWLPINT